jgi:hypothetical protein
MLNVEKDILFLEQFINEEKEQVNEVIGTAAVVKGIASVLSIPVILQIMATALQKINTTKLKFYFPEEELDEIKLKSLLYPRGPESAVGDEDIKYSPKSVKVIIEFINKYGMKSANALNQYNNNEKLEFAKRNAGDQTKKNIRGALSANDPLYQISLILNSIQQNMQTIIDEIFETVSAGIVESINLHPAINLSIQDNKYYSKVVTKLSKVLLFVVVGASIFQTTDSEGAKNIAEKGVGIFKKFKNGKKFYEFLKDLEVFILEVSAFVGDAPAAAQLATVVEVNYALRAIQAIKQKITEKFGDFNLLEFLVELERKIADYFKEGNVKSPSFQDKLSAEEEFSDAEARQASLSGEDYYGSPVKYENFLRQYIKMLLS